MGLFAGINEVAYYISMIYANFPFNLVNILLLFLRIQASALANFFLGATKTPRHKGTQKIKFSIGFLVEFRVPACWQAGLRFSG